MKKIGLFLIVMLVLTGVCYGEYTSNAYQIYTFVNSSQTSKGITLPYTSRNITIINGDGADAVLVDVKSDSTTIGVVGTAGTFLLPFGKQVTFRNFATNGISLIYLSSEGEASPISVIATY